MAEQDFSIIQKAKELLNYIKAGKCQRSEVNILILGVKGAGKSSLINSLIMAFNKDGFKEAAQFGERRLEGQATLTQSVRCHKLEIFLGEDIFKKTAIRLFDIPGLRTDYDKAMLKYLENLITGRDRMWFPTKKDYKNILIFVHPAPEPEPENLLNAVASVTLNTKREIPIFLAITKMDLLSTEKIQKEYERSRRTIMLRLALADNPLRLFELKLYCNAVTPEFKRSEEIDTKLCELWSKVLDPVYCDREVDNQVQSWCSMS